MEQYSSEDARRELRLILNEVERGEPVSITRYGKPLAVIVRADWYEKAASALADTAPERGSEKKEKTQKT